MNVKAYQLYEGAVTLRPATEVTLSGQSNPTFDGELSFARASQQGWVALCPVAFMATWNGGSRPEDIEIRLEEPSADRDPLRPAFVQSQHGDGLLTFHPGYQFKSDYPYLLWLRGPINMSKDSLAPLESVFDASLLPCTATSDWQFTCPSQTVHFAAGEPFATLLLCPEAELAEANIEVLQREENVETSEQTFQQMVENPALRELFVQLGATPEEEAPQSAPQSWAARLIDPPSVSCICPTYGRVELLEEAIESFLRQDYPGPKELIVLNDYDGQMLVFDHPDVHILNLPNRFHSIGEKYKAAAALDSHDLIFVWHDDDIYLPHRLSLSVAQLSQNRTFFKADKAWFWNDGQLSGPEKNVFHSGSCWRRDLFSKIEGYPHWDNQYDIEFERLCQSAAPGSIQVERLQPEDVYYIYRWNGTKSYHLSALGADGQEQQKVADYVARQAARGQIPQGQIQLKPHWESDYTALVQNYLSAPPTTQNSPQIKREATVSCFDTIDGHIDLRQFGPVSFCPSSFLANRENYLRRHGELYSREFYLIDARRLVYLPVPKVACTAIKLALAKASGIDFAPDQDIEYVVHFHPKWRRAQGKLKEEQNGYFRFAFVRNPFDRLVSCYRQKIIATPTASGQAPLYHDYFFALPANSSFADFAQRVSRIPDALADAHFKSQYAILYSESELLVDYIGKFERLDQDWRPIAAKYQLDPLLIQANVSKNKAGCHSDYRIYYNEALVQLVYERYRKGIERFGYEEEYQQLLAFVRPPSQTPIPDINEWNTLNGKERSLSVAHNNQ